MTNYRKILEMHSQGLSQRNIETNVHSSHQTVKAVLDRARKLSSTHAFCSEKLADKKIVRQYE